MTTTVQIDPHTGGSILSQERRILVNWLDDAAYLGLMVYVYDYTGFNRVFLPLPEMMFTNPVLVQALRYGLLFGSMLELRRWLQSYGIPTELISYYLDKLALQVL
jgi:hypothetical protein